LQKNIFLPLLNNQTYNPYSEGNKTGITRLKKLVAIGGPDDGVITPWQSRWVSNISSSNTTLFQTWRLLAFI
jgi:palmitoyl-protein thioesterase